MKGLSVDFEINNENIQHRVFRLKSNFWWFSLLASVNHALSYVVTSFATSLLDPSLGGMILGLTWTLNAVSGFVVSTPVLKRLGFKTSMLISFWGYTIQITCLTLAVIIPTYARPIAPFGCLIAGFTSAIWWTAQGVYFEHTCLEIEKVEILRVQDQSFSINSIRSDLSAHWTVVYQMSDIFVFLSLSAIPLLASVSVPDVLIALSGLGVLTSLLGHTIDNINDDPHPFTFKELFHAIAAVPKQLQNDSRVTLLTPFVFGFGITTAMFAYYVNSSLITDSSNLGIIYLGLLEAFSYVIATISAYPYAIVSKKYHYGEDFVIQFGSLSFLLTGVFVFALSTQELSSWAVILTVKGLFGIGRGVFEGSCRAVYARLFVGDDLASAFSSQTLFTGLSGGVCFLLFGILNKDSIAAVTIINGSIALVTYAILVSTSSGNIPLPWSELCQKLSIGARFCGKKVVSEDKSRQELSSVDSPFTTPFKDSLM